MNMAKKKAAKKKAVKKKARKKHRVTAVSARAITKKTKGKKKTGMCFVLMPFRSPFNTYYTGIIQPAVTKAGLEPRRGDSLFRPAPIMADIWAMIQNAKALVAVLTGKNANVFYELGLGHAIGKPIVLVSETMDDVPFDLQALRVILYDKDHPKWGDKLRNDITKALEATIGEPVEAVPTMFRKKVKSQAPSDSEVSMRLSSLERRVASLQEEAIDSQSIGPIREMGDAEATELIIAYAQMGTPPQVIVDKLSEFDVPTDWVLRKLRKMKLPRPRTGYKRKVSAAAF
jgi:hypothetical protein